MPFSVPVVPDPDTARRWLTEELGRAEYQPTLLERIRDAIQRALDWVGARMAGADGLSLLWAVLFAVVLVALATYVLLRLRRVGGREDDAAPVFADRRRDAATHRALAEAALRDGDHDTALVEAVRALTSGLIERDLLPDVTGVTTAELTAQATSRFPGEAAVMAATGRAFDEVRYGDRHTDRSAVVVALELEERVRGAVPDRSGALAPHAAVPR